MEGKQSFQPLQWLGYFAPSLELARLVVGKNLILVVMHFHLPFKGMDRPWNRKTGQFLS